jgi:hypothetical protein
MASSRSLRGAFLPVGVVGAAVAVAFGVAAVTGDPADAQDPAPVSAPQPDFDDSFGGGGRSGDHECERRERVALPPGLRPEGITSDGARTFYVGSLADGRVVTGDLRSGDTEVLVPGRSGRVAVGMQLEADADRLWVAGGPTGAVTVYDAGTGRQLRRWTVEGSGFLNDVTVTDGAAYVTDSQVQRLVVVPLGEDGSLPARSDVTTLALTGDVEFDPADFNANGIRALDEDTLVVVQSSTGTLFRVDADSGEAEAVEVTGGRLSGGDGLELGDGRLFVVRGGGGDDVVVLRLRRGGARAVLEDVVTDPRLDVPTTATFADGRLWTVNARFGTEATPTTAYDVVRVDVE